MEFIDEWAAALVEFLDYELDSPLGRRGRSYFKQRRVIGTDFLPDDEGPVITARVRGSGPLPYDVRIGFDAEGLYTECACVVGGACKHCIAVGLALVAAGYEMNQQWAFDAEFLLPDDVLANPSRYCDAVSKNVRDFLSGVEKPLPSAITESPGRPWWREYIEAVSPDEIERALEHGVAARIGRKLPEWLTSNFVDNMRGLENRIYVLRQFDRQLAMRMSLTRPLTKDPHLEAFLTSEEAARMDADFERRKTEQQLFSWLDQSRPALVNRCSFNVVWTAMQNKDSLAELYFQLLLTSKRCHREPRSASSMDTLYRDVLSGKYWCSTPEREFIQWLGTRAEVQYGKYGSIIIKGRDWFPVFDVALWLDFAGPRGLLEWETGAPVTAAGPCARLTVSDSADGTRWAIELPEGMDEATRVVPLAEAELIHDHSYNTYYTNEALSHLARVYVRRGNALARLETGGMPLQVFQALTRMPQVPIERLRGTHAGRVLAARLTLDAGPGTETDLLHTVAVTPTLECRAGEDGAVSFTARAMTADDQKFILEYWNTWQSISGPATAAAEPVEDLANLTAPEDSPTPANTETAPISSKTLCIAPRDEDVAPLEEWMRQAVPAAAQWVRANAHLVSLHFSVKTATLARLTRFWFKRPKGVTYLGNKAFLKLVATRSVPRFNINVESGGVDWLKVSVELEKEIEALSLSEVMKALDAENEELVMLPGGRMYARDDLENYKRQLEALHELGVGVDAGPQRIHAMQLAGLSVNALIEAVSDTDERLHELAEQARGLLKRFKGIPAAAVEEETAGYLRPYQRHGADFLVWAAKTFGGALLADDMGLGKTIQVLAALTALKKAQKNHLPSLVVCPASVAHNWLREVRRFAPTIRAVVTESGKERFRTLENLGEYDLVVKNYALARRDADLLRAQEWLMVCVDEAQAIKNPDADITRVVKSLPAQYRFALTGTPIENRLTDLWSITDFAVPGYLQNLHRFESRARNEESSLLLRMLRARLRPVLARRMKQEVAPELPPRIEERRDCEMVPSQRKEYAAEVKKTRMLLDAIKEKRIVGKHRIQILAALTRLRQICCDPALVGLPDKGSGKVNELMDLLGPLIESGNKVLVFSQFVRMLNRLETRLAHASIPTRMLTGHTTHRQELLEGFEKDTTPGVFLISLKAGGVGINLMSAAHVILFDPWWNPAVEAQAIDRTHRIGQNKTVLAFRLVTLGTIEERILELQERKRSLVKNVLDEGAFNRTLSREDFEFLLEE